MALSYVGYEVDVSDLERLLAEVEGALNLRDNELVEIAQRMALFIRERTAIGVDYGGRMFQQYSENYADFRSDAGRNVAPVDLLFKGEMLAAMTGFAEAGDAVVGFTSAAEARKAGWHNEGTRRMPERRFLDLFDGGREAQTLAEMAAEFMAQRIEGL